jgi:hypothetical protein
VAGPFPEKGGIDGGIKARASWFKQTKHKQQTKNSQERDTYTMKRTYTECQEGGWNEEPLSKKEKKDEKKQKLCLDAWTVVVSFCDDETWRRLTQVCREIYSLREIESLTIHRTITVPKKVQRMKHLKAYLKAMYGALFNLKLGPLECLLRAERIDDDLAQYLNKTQILEINGCNTIDIDAFWYLKGVRELKIWDCGTLSSRSFCALRNLKKLILKADIEFTEGTFQDLRDVEILHVAKGSLNDMKGIEHMKNLRQLKLPYYGSTRDEISKRIGKTVEIL